MTDLPKKPLPDISHTLDEIERRRAHALEQMKRFAAEAEEMERDKAQLQEIAAKLAEKYGLVVRVDDEPLPARPVDREAQTLRLRDLIKLYREDKKSPYQKLKHNSRESYNAILGLIEREYGAQSIADLNAAVLQDWYEKWKATKAAMGRAKMVMLRGLFNFGFATLSDEHCARLLGIVSTMSVEIPKARTERLTRDQADLIRAKAHEKERASIALAQAFQMDCDLLQKDVIGEWLPVAEPGISDVISNGQKWVRGIRWEEIDENLVLDHPPSGKGKIDLKKAPMVLEELERVKAKNGGKLPANGPIVVSEWDDLPWTAPEFRRWWRTLADACGIPKSVRSADSRARPVNGKSEGETKTSNKSEGLL
ncbi:hypothetical protein [Bradyrhizobium sp. SZCCHNR1020]|uniref:hypothetical protein n=1 Tax=Bradyrhizobium sp. SZCCHNR1020 TaxID=3057343 RepID=UPI0029164FD7|nr:hypothetical protein [Bradyrhizobium sp. SZCCHNR1020]